MKTRRLAVCCALLGALLVSDVSASAEERGGTVHTGLSGTTISGSTSSTASWQHQSLRQRLTFWWRIATLWCKLRP
jgi:hypothetical protein